MEVENSHTPSFSSPSLLKRTALLYQSSAYNERLDDTVTFSLDLVILENEPEGLKLEVYRHVARSEKYRRFACFILLRIQQDILQFNLILL
jgi:hypothetical protein